jgi:hypothetical protein
VRETITTLSHHSATMPYKPSGTGPARSGMAISLQARFNGKRYFQGIMCFGQYRHPVHPAKDL